MALLRARSSSLAQDGPCGCHDPARPGDADRPATGYRTRDFAADIAAIADSLDLGPAVIVGHSMGSTHALRFAIDYPKLTRGLVLVGSFASYRSNPAIAALWESAVSGMTDPVSPAFVREFQESTLAQPVPKAFSRTRGPGSPRFSSGAIVTR